MCDIKVTYVESLKSDPSADSFMTRNQRIRRSNSYAICKEPRRSIPYNSAFAEIRVTGINRVQLLNISIWGRRKSRGHRSFRVTFTEVPADPEIDVPIPDPDVVTEAPSDPEPETPDDNPTAPPKDDEPDPPLAEPNEPNEDTDTELNDEDSSNNDSGDTVTEAPT